MPQGLQVFDTNGNLQLEVTNRITTLIGVYTITNANPRVVITSPLFATNTAFFAKNLNTAQGNPNNTNESIEIQTATTYTLEFKRLPPNTNYQIYVGVY
ncbi:hypothetical protein [Psychrobacter sp. UBA6291]|uniref:hypothetical protein n=1 Tax=Psychrobacter sp. UBA6291 TaxID=1947357 RepID=UPI00257D3648|nr:hypothetical protein [Psychrobacter sp. UBA6291]